MDGHSAIFLPETPSFAIFPNRFDLVFLLRDRRSVSLLTRPWSAGSSPCRPSSRKELFLRGLLSPSVAVIELTALCGKTDAGIRFDM